MKFKNRTQAKRQTKLSYLGNSKSNPKVMKSLKVSNNMTYILLLSPANTSGYNVCPYSTPECRMGCLFNSGHVKIEDWSKKTQTRRSRAKKTKLFFEQRKFFMDWLVAEIEAEKEKAHKNGFDFSVRLNGMSDIDWTEIKHNNKTIFELFPNVQFYDYTKNYEMYKKELPLNYHLTFSFSGRNMYQSISLLKKGYNVAVVFDTPDFPETWNGFPVINGDLTDYRPLDGNGVVVGLKYKELANNKINEKVKNSCFVINNVTIPENNTKVVEV